MILKENGTTRDEAKSKDGRHKRMKRGIYEKELRKLQVELCQLQEWVKDKGLRVIVVFEGRDAAGKGGTIKAITERVSPRVFRLVALPAPSDREKSQMFMQRYIEHFPGRRRGRHLRPQLVQPRRCRICDGILHRRTASALPGALPADRKYIVDGGITLIKFWLEVGKDEQERKFYARIDDPLRQWKLSPMDIESYRRWYDYSRARDLMLKATDTKHAPWHHRAFRRQAAGAAELHFAHPEPYSVQEGAAPQSQAAQAVEQGKIRR